MLQLRWPSLAIKVVNMNIGTINKTLAVQAVADTILEMNGVLSLGEDIG